VVLIDGETASDGEAAANGFRRLGLGKLIGTRTWGGGIWLSMQNQTVDKGVAAAGEFGSYGPEGVWVVEGRGIDPDITVDNPPDVAFRGEDPQLEAALKHLQDLIAKDPRPVPTPPPYPNKVLH
jgi:tricorn protease